MIKDSNINLVAQETLTFHPPERGFINITQDIANLLTRSEIRVGVCNLFLLHTSASIIICENAAKAVQEDLERFMLRLIPDGDPLFQHVEEGIDDMPAHVRNVITQSSLSIPITNQALNLGRWQGIYLWEHRLQRRERQVIVTLMGC